MIRKLVRQMLTAQVLSALTVSLCLLIDSIMIGRFLGNDAMAAYGYANPLLLAIGAIGSMLAAGIQVSCSKSLARGDHEETNRGFSSSIAVVLGISLAFIALVVPLRGPLASMLGAGDSGGIAGMTKDYLAGFSIGAPGSMGALVLVPFLQMAGQSGLLIAAVGAMTVADVVLDLLLLQLPNPMFGMGLASSLSYYVALGIGAIYFLSKKNNVFRFSAKGVSLRKIGELFRNGIPASFAMASAVLLIYVLNCILGKFGHEAVAALSVITTVGNAAACINTGIGGVALTMAGVFYNEEDRTGLRDLVRILVRHAVVLGLVAGLVLGLLAPLTTELFLPGEKDAVARGLAALGLRIFAAGLVPACLCSVFKNTYQASERVILTELISLVEGFLMPALAAFVFSRFLGTTGVWLYYPLGEWLALLCLGLFIYRKTHRLPWDNSAWLLLRPDFGVAEEDLLEADIGSLDEVPEVAKRAEAFCLARGQSERTAKHIALCIEEMAVNTIEHGFTLLSKPRTLSVRVLRKEDRWILRFRDNCFPRDPIHYVPGEDREALGIRLVLSLATRARYTYSLNLNNLTLELPPR